ncbi:MULTISPECIES: hypothetical protein [unclassified Paenibacillus]|uniref:hypothetical protein n=1 Tax=unclassified Paenibacillus TaxID=185978 RepID=UPI0009A778F9|nr:MULTISPECIES: hypothetical protein [unclassified Paenibacillus]SLK14783.1 hypothetical protein SAMN06272722_10994 [Paenibacillus sp. RU5A]SOC73653.1 hypothetical protein SAMN05880581_10994 [Paenibacillus sp. RU26A]SOC75828.1 hypothetical protein SAMN05880586_10994 [Paenibacillus sp. RU5M]
MLHTIIDFFIWIKNWLDSSSDLTKRIAVYIVACFVIIFLISFTLTVIKEIIILIKQIFILIKKQTCVFSNSSKNIIQSFNESGIIEHKTLYLLPDGLKLFFGKKSGLLLKTGIYMLIPENLKERWFEGSIQINNRINEENKVSQNGIELQILDVMIMPGQVTKVLFKISNLEKIAKTIQLYKLKARKKDDEEFNVHSGQEKDLIKRIKLFVDNHILLFERFNEKQLIREINFGKENQITFEAIFESLALSELREAKNVTLEVEFRYLKHGNENAKQIKLSSSLEISSQKETNIHNIIRNQISLPIIFNFLAFGGYLMFLMPLIIIFSLLTLFIYSRILFVCSALFLYLMFCLAINLNSKLAQLYWDMSNDKETEITYNNG